MNTPSFRSFSSCRWLRPGWLLAVAAFAALPSFAAPPPAPPAGASPTPASSPGVEPAAPASQPQASATELVVNMRRALGVILKAQGAKASETAFRTAKARVFARTLANAAAQVDGLGKAVQTPDVKTFDAMARTGHILAALQVTARYNGIEDDEVEEGFEKLTAAYGVFRRNYGRDLVAARTEGESSLSPSQRAARDELQKSGTALTKSLTALQPAMKSNPAAAFEFGAILKSLARLNRPPRDRREFLNHLAIAELLLGRANGTSVYVKEIFPEDGKKMDSVQAEFQSYQEAFHRAMLAAFAEEKPAEVFSRKAAYVEDLSVAGITDAELPALLEGATKAAEKIEARTDPVAARAADAQINAEDPDDDTSLEPAGGDGDPAAPEAGND